MRSDLRDARTTGDVTSRRHSDGSLSPADDAPVGEDTAVLETLGTEKRA